MSLKRQYEKSCKNLSCLKASTECALILIKVVTVTQNTIFDVSSAYLLPSPFKRQVKFRLPSAGIIRSSPYSPR